MPLPLLAIPLAQAGVKGISTFFAFNSASNQEKLDDTALLERYNDSLFPLHARVAFTLRGVVRTIVAFPKDGSVTAEQLGTPVSPAEAKALIPIVVQANQETLVGYQRTESKDNFSHVTLTPAVLKDLNELARRAPAASLLGAPTAFIADKDQMGVTQASLFDSLVPTDLVSDITSGAITPVQFLGFLLIAGAVVLLVLRTFAK